jgi:serine/threonine protein kinase
MTPACWICGAVLDAGGYEPLVRVVCRNCGQKNLLQRTFDHFVPVETLGAGGMGTVYKARDTQLERFVALKLLHKDLTGEADHDAQLQQEARIAAAVNHPNVVQIFSLGTDHGQFYVVMELIDHGSLDDFIESQGRVPEHQVLDIGIQIARGLRAAHRKGLIHRDVKPANILFVDEQAAKIGDFGLAAFATQHSENTESDRVIWGTPPYVAPERLCNQPEDVRSDIYSFMETANRKQHKFRDRVVCIEAAPGRVADYRARCICADCTRFAANDRTRPQAAFFFLRRASRRT